jgi:cytochrome P450
MAPTSAREQARSLRMPPGPAPLPILGRYGKKMLFYRDPIAYHRHVYQTYGTLASFIMGGRKLLAYGPEYNRQILNQPDLFNVERIAVPAAQDTSLYRLGLGLNAMNGEVHRRQRRLMLPAFHRQHVEHYRDTMVAVSEQMLDRLPLGQVIDIAHLMQQITLCIASATLFGVDAISDANSLGHQIARWIKLNANRMIYLFPVDWPGTPLHRLKQISEQLEAYIRTLIQANHARAGDPRDVLALLSQARDEADGSQLTEGEVIGQATLLFFAGFETSAVALTWTLFLLAQHPAVLADLLDELESVLQGAAPTIEQTRSLPLLDRVIKESLRLFPPAIHGGRIATQPFEMGDYAFPAGTKVMYSEYITHRIPDIYPEPQRFLPERWAGPEPATFAYIPFLAGPRRCLGAEFAMLELKIVLALLLQRYRFTLPVGTRIDRSVLFTLEPKHGMPMLLERQDRQWTKVAVDGDIHELVDL